MPPKNKLNSMLALGSDKSQKRRQIKSNLNAHQIIDQSQLVQKKSKISQKKMTINNSQDQQFIQQFSSSGTEKIDSDDEIKNQIEELKNNNTNRKLQYQEPTKSNTKNNTKTTQYSLEAMFKQNRNRQINFKNNQNQYLKYNGGLDNEEQLMKKALQQSLKQTKKDQFVNISDYGFVNNKKEEVYKTKIYAQKQEIYKNKKKPTQTLQSITYDQKPKRQSIKKIPKDGPLKGETIVLTGEFEPYDKNQLIELLEELGAVCPKSLAKKTTFLIQGTYVIDHFKRRVAQNALNTGKSKQSRLRGIKIIANQNINEFFKQKTGKTLTAHLYPNIQLNEEIKQQINQQPMIIQRKPLNKSNQSIRWVDKYKPKSLDEVVGQCAQIKNLREWLLGWNTVHFLGIKHDAKDLKGYMASGNMNSKAALITGNPGLGKTTAVRLIAADLHYKIVQFNASDVRNKKSVMLLEKGSYSLDLGHNLFKTFILMDEVDGMSGGDRGGITALIQTIKKSRIPIICVANDRQSDKIRSLAGYCYDIKFHRPDKRMVVKMLQGIVQNEGGNGSDKALGHIVQNFQNDLRQIINYLELFMKTVSRDISLKLLTGDEKYQKDSSIMLNPFQATRILLNATQYKSMTLPEKMNVFFIDSDIIPLMIHENYLSSVSKSSQNNDILKPLVNACEGFVLSDQLDNKIRKQQQWLLMPSYGFMSSIYTTQLVSESIGFPQFPVWLGKNSSSRKNRRLIRELRNCLLPTITGSTKAVQIHYSVLLWKKIIQYLKAQNIKKCLALMEAYSIKPEILSQHLYSLQFGEEKDSLTKIPAAIKSQLTKSYNKKYKQSKKKIQKKKQMKVTEHNKFDPLLEEMQNMIIEDEEDGNENHQSDFI